MLHLNQFLNTVLWDYILLVIFFLPMLFHFFLIFVPFSTQWIRCYSIVNYIYTIEIVLISIIRLSLLWFVNLFFSHFSCFAFAAANDFNYEHTPRTVCLHGFCLWIVSSTAAAAAAAQHNQQNFNGMGKQNNATLGMAGRMKVIFANFCLFFFSSLSLHAEHFANFFGIYFVPQNMNNAKLWVIDILAEKIRRKSKMGDFLFQRIAKS